MSLTHDQNILISILLKCEAFDWANGNKEPRAQISITEGDVANLKRLMENASITQCFADGRNLGTSPSVVDTLVGRTATFEFQLPIPKKDVAIVKDVDALLGYNEFLTNFPERSFFIQNKLFGVPKTYSETVTFFNLLKQTADHYNQNGNEYTCFYYDGVKISIPIKYSFKDLCILDDIEQLKESFCTPRLKEKVRIFRSAIIKVAITAQSENESFVHLLNNFSQIKKNYEQDWNFYLSEFSLKELLNELEKTILDIADKLTTALSDLQKTMITIPLAIIFAAPRIQTQQIQTLTNGIIVASVWIFALFTWTFFSNHKRTLNFIAREIKEQEESCLKKHKGLEESIQSKFTGLKERCKYQTKYRQIVGSVMWITVIVATLFFFSPQLSKISNKYKTSQSITMQHEKEGSILKNHQLMRLTNADKL